MITHYGDRFGHVSPEETPAPMSALVDWCNAAECAGKLSPEETPALFHYRYIRIHPFGDDNGRIARPDGELHLGTLQSTTVARF